MKGVVHMTRSSLHEIADHLERARLNDDEFGEPDWAEIEAWTDRLRGLAGPVEPTSYAARVQFTGAPVTFVEEWARESASNSWWCLFTTREERIGHALLWHELVDRAEEIDARLEVIEP